MKEDEKGPLLTLCTPSPPFQSLWLGQSSKTLRYHLHSKDLPPKLAPLEHPLTAHETEHELTPSVEQSQNEMYQSLN